MRISDEEQIYTDFDWFCVDADGHVGHFASAGFKQLPPSVAESAEDLALVNGFFTELSSIADAHELDELLTLEHRTERYLSSFVAMADRGIFSFDIDSYLKPETSYFRVAIPKHPLCFADLPARVQKVLGRTKLRDQLFDRCSSIPYADTLNL